MDSPLVDSSDGPYKMSEQTTVLIPSLVPFFERAEHFSVLAGAFRAAGRDRPDALTVARLAHQMGEADLGRALLARTGGLLDSADALAVLAEPVPLALLQAARARPGTPLTLPSWSAGERELFIRVLAGYLLSADPRAEPQPGPSDPRFAGLWVLPAQADQKRWQQGLNCLRRGAAENEEAAQLPPSTWTSASWGSRWGIRRFLAEQAERPELGTAQTERQQIAVESTEELIATLSAAYSRNLPRLVGLLSRPLLIDGLQSLPQAVLETLGGLLQDAVRVFGWTVIGLPSVERGWPDVFGSWPVLADLTTVASSVDAESVEAGFLEAVSLEPAPPVAGPTSATFHLHVWNEQPTLEWLAQTVQNSPGRTLVMLPSRGSAARFAGLVKSEALLSTSLCPVHLDDRADLLADQLPGAPQCVIATTLPSTMMGHFDQVWHLVAPLPYLVEAAELCSGDFHVLSLVDVAVPLMWAAQVQHTVALLQGDPEALTSPEIHQAYYAVNQAAHTERRKAHLQGCRAELNYASLASELLPRTEHSVPVLIPYNEQARQAIAQMQRSEWLSSNDLQYAGWLTPSEAMRATQRGDAQPSGWPLIWTAAYNPVYGLAADVVAQTQLTD